MAKEAFGSARWDFFYSAQDRIPFKQTYANTTLSAQFIPNGADSQTITVASTTGFRVGEIIRLEDTYECYARVLNVVSGTQMEIRAIESEATTGGLSQPYPYGQKFAATNTEVYNAQSVAGNNLCPQKAHRLTIDLTEAPADETFSYLVLVNANTYASAAAKQWQVSVRSQVKPDEIYEAAGSNYMLALFTALNVTAKEYDIHPYNCAFVEEFTPGQRWSIDLETMCRDSGNTATLQNMRIMALRIDTTHPEYKSAGTGVVGSNVQTTTSTSEQDGVSLTLGAETSNRDDYMVVAACVMGNTDSTYGNRNPNIKFDVDISSEVYVRPRMEADDDLYSVGYLRVDDGHSSGEILKWIYYADNPSGGTAKISDQFIAFVPLAAIPGIEAYVRTQSVSNAASGDTPDFNSSASSSGTTEFTGLTPGYHVMFLNITAKVTGSGSDIEGYVRPEFGTDPPWIYDHNKTPRGIMGPSNVRDVANINAFFFHRAEITGTTVDIGYSIRVPDGAASDMDTNDELACLFRERGKFEPEYQDKTTIAAEVQTSAVYESWESLGSDQFRRTLADVGMVDGVRVNQTEYTKQTTLGSIAAQEWHWDMDTRVLTIQMDSGDAPTDADRTVRVSWLLFYARDYVALVDNDDEHRPHEPRIESPPQFTQELQNRDGDVSAATGIGQLDLAAGDGTLDSYISQELLEGARCTILRGFEGHSLDRSDYDVSLRATISEPSLKPDTLSVRLFGATKRLESIAIATTSMTIYEGSETVDDQVEPHIWGTVFRAPAYRVTAGGNLDTDTNSYRIAAHALEDVIAVYEDAGDPLTAVTTFTEDLANGEIDVVNSNLPNWTPEPDNPDQPPDVLYVNCVGYAETIGGASVPIETAGRIWRDLAVRVAGYDATEIDEAAVKLLDSRWRRRFAISGDPLVQIRRPPTIGLYIDDGTTTVADAMNEIARTAYFYWLELRSGRLTVGVPDLSARNELADEGNEGFELDASEPWPWYEGGGSSYTTTSSKVFEGLQAAQFSTGSEAGYLYRKAQFHRSGKWVFSVLAALESGRADAFRLAVVPPGDGYNRTFSDPVAITSGEWTRVNLPFELTPGEQGTGLISVHPFRPETETPDLPVQADLQLWLRADNMLTNGDVSADGETIATWTDDSGNGNDATQGTAEAKPTYRANVHAGHPAVSFDRTDDQLDTGLDIGSQPYSIFCVCAFRDGDGSLGSSSHFRNVVRTASSNVIMGLRGSTYGIYNGTSTIAGETIADERWVAFSYVVDGSGGEFWLDGESQGTDAAAPALTDISISRGDTNGFMFGFVGEVLVYDVALSDEDREAVEDYLMSKWGIADVSVNLDNAWLMPIAAQVETIGEQDGSDPALNFMIEESEVVPDIHFEAEIGYNPFMNGGVPTPTRLLTDVMARSLYATYDQSISESRTALTTAKRISVLDTIVSNETPTEAKQSAAGIAAHMLVCSSRMRNVMRGKLQGELHIPTVGEVLYHPPTLRIPAAASAFPFWMITGVDDETAATEVSLQVEREIDPVKDRREIAQSVFPANAIGLSLTDAAISGFDEVVPLRKKYIRGVKATPSFSPNIHLTGGYLMHRHTLSHTHTGTAHSHTWSVTSVDAMDDAYHYDEGTQCYPAYDVLNNFLTHDENLSRATDEGGHTHTAPSSTPALSSTTPSPAAPSSDIYTNYSSNEVDFCRVVFRRRTGSSDTIPTTMIVGYLGSAAPTGWTRETTLDGYFLKGATQRDGTATTLASDWTATDETDLTVSAGGDVGLYTRLTLVDGGNTTHVAVSEVKAGGVRTVRLLNEVGDTNGVSYASATTTVTPDDETVGTTSTVADHDHDTTVPAHTHQAAHWHTSAIATNASGSGVGSIAADTVPNSYGQYVPARDYHTHTVGGSDSDVHYNTNADESGSASGSAVSGANVFGLAKLDYIELMFIKPSSPEEELPADTVLFWDTATPPIGWSIMDEAGSLFVKGAESGQAPAGGGFASHNHSFTAAAHTYTHSHTNNTGIPQYTSCYKEDNHRAVAANFVGPQPATDYSVASAGIYQYDLYRGHRHRVTLATSSSDASSLQQATSQNSGAALWLERWPPHAALYLIRKD